MEKDDVLIRNATLVTHEDTFVADVRVRDGRIVEIGERLAAAGEEQFEARGLHLLPGLIDPHVHLRDPGAVHKEDFRSGTRAALAGGVNTVLDMPNTNPPTVDEAGWAAKLEAAERRALTDYGLFFGATAENVGHYPNHPVLVGLKVYLGATTGSLLTAEFGPVYEHMERFPREKVVAVHAEDEEARRYFAVRGSGRPPVVAVVAVAKVLAMADDLRRAVHICHVSTAAELALIADARRRGVPVTCEVTPHHLFLDRERAAELGSYARVNPPLRDRADVEALWAGLAEVDCFTTDHAPHLPAEKESDDPPAGLPGLETMLPLLLTAVHEGRLSLPDVVRRAAYNPARIFGLPRKGRLAVGADADLVLVDLERERRLEGPWFTRCGWSPYEGRRVRGAVEKVYRRGRLAYASGEIVVG
jgi:dihydroorotase